MSYRECRPHKIPAISYAFYPKWGMKSGVHFSRRMVPGRWLEESPPSVAQQVIPVSLSVDPQAVSGWSDEEVAERRLRQVRGTESKYCPAIRSAEALMAKATEIGQR